MGSIRERQPEAVDKVHAFFVSQTWTNMKRAFKGASALALAMSLGQNTKIANVESTTMYVSTIFATLYIPMSSRVQMIELILVGGTLTAAFVPFGMLGYLCSKATRNPVVDAMQTAQYVAAQAAGNTAQATIATFYQGRPAAVSAVFLFITAWFANVAKTLFPPFIFAVVSATIVLGITFLEGFLFPTWAQFYSLVEQVLYCFYIGIASSLLIGLFIFPYTSREPYLRLTGNYLDLVETMLSHHALHFSSMHTRMRGSRERDSATAASSDASDEAEVSRDSEDLKDKQQTDEDLEVAQLQGMRSSLTALLSALEMAKVPAKRELAYGHLRGSELEAMHKLCRGLIVPVLGCNLWSQIVETLQVETKATSQKEAAQSSFLHSLGIDGSFTSEDQARFIELMNDRVSPRIRSLSGSCSDAVIHIKRALHLGVYAKAPFYVRPFTKPPRVFNDEDLEFSDQFEADIARFWDGKHVSNDHDYFAASETRHATMLIMYMESSLYSIAKKLLEFSRWADDMQRSGTMTTKKIILPKPKRYTNALKTAYKNLKKETEPAEDELRKLPTNVSGSDQFVESASQAFLNKGKPTLVPRHGPLTTVLTFFSQIKAFIFESSVSAFGFRAAVAMTAGALPAFFPDSITVFLRYRLIWITFTVLLGMQPVLGRGIATMVFRMVGTIVGGVIGLVVVEIGRVPAGIIPVFALTVLPQLYLQAKNPKVYLLPTLLSVITEVLVVGNNIMTDKLGVARVEVSGQMYLMAPALMGFRILLTLAGVVIAAFFSVFPSLPVARQHLRDQVSKRCFVLADTYMLCAMRGAGAKYELPPGLDKAIIQKRTESLALSNASHESLGVTKFEPSLRGSFPAQEWSKLLTLFDNFATSLAILNNVYTLAATESSVHEMDLDALMLHKSGEKYFHVVTVSLFALGNSINLWQPLPPSLPSVIDAHYEMQERLRQIGVILRRKEQEESYHDDILTHLGAYIMTNAMMSKFLEEILAQVSVLVGTSGFTTYMASHLKNEKAE